MKSVKLVLLVTILLGLPAGVRAQFTLETNLDNTLTITAYTGSDASVTIPDTIGGMPVTVIGPYAFLANTNLTSITISTNIGGIREQAFANCIALTSVTIPSSVTNMWEYLFSYCTGLTNAVIGTNVIRMSDGVFSHCTSLVSVTWPTSLTSIPDYTFLATGLTNLSFPSTVTNISYQAYLGCPNLVNLEIPDGIVTIGQEAFSGAGVTNLVIGNHVTDIGQGAFMNCSGLSRLTIPDNVRRIGSATFVACNGMTNVTIGSGVTNIDSGAFHACTNLAAFAVNPNNSNFSSSDGLLFDKNKTALLKFPAVRVGAYEISNNITSIGNNAFAYCTHLGSITVSDTVTNIGDGAFADCWSLTNVTVGSGVASIGASAFAESMQLAQVFFRGNAPVLQDWLTFLDDPVTVYYLPGATNWGPLFGGAPTALWFPTMETNDSSFGTQTNQFGFTIVWTSGQTVAVEACTNLANPDWQPIQTNLLTTGSAFFSDPQWTNYPNRFYRLRSP